MLPVSGVTRIKIKRDSFKLNGKSEANKRRWTGLKPGLNPLADDHRSSPADGVSLDRDLPDKDGGDPGTSPSTASRGGAARARGTCTRSRPASTKRPCEHKKDIFYRLRLALCFARDKLRNGGKRDSTEAHALSFIDRNESVDVSIERTPQFSPNSSSPGQEKPRRGRGRPRTLFTNHLGGSDGQVKTTLKTEVRSRARRSVSGRAASFSSKVELRRRLRSDTKKQCKRLVKNACCALCGDVKYTAPPSQNLASLPNRRSRAGRPSHKGAGHAPESRQTPDTPPARLHKYPMVKLCDVGRVFAIASRDFSCVLPAVLRLKRKRKSPFCLKKEFAFLVHPHLHGIRSHRSNIQSWEISTPTHGCASFPSGDPPSGATGSTAETPDGSAWERDGSLGRNPDCEGMRQTDAERSASALQRCDDDDDPVASCFCEKAKACLMESVSERPSGVTRSVSPLILRRVSAHGDGSRGEEEPEDERRSEDSDGDLNSPEPLSCQRTQAYVFFSRSSCARTGRAWPFPRSGPPDELLSSRTGRRWIEASVPATLQTSGRSSDTDVQNKPLKRSESGGEGRTPSSALLELSLEDPRGAQTREADARGSALERQPPTLANIETTLKSLVNNPRVVLTRVSVLESKQCPKPTQAVSESSERVHKHKPNGLSSAASNTHCLLQMAGQSGSKHPVITAEPDKDLSDASSKISARPVGQSERAPSVDEEGNEAAGRRLNPNSLSAMCLKVEMLKSPHPSGVKEQENGSDAPPSPDREPESEGDGKQTSGPDGATITGSSEDEQECDAPSPDEDASDEERASTSPAVSHDFLDISRAYEEDVLVLDVIQDDPELFGAVVSESGRKPDTPTEKNAKKKVNHCRTECHLEADCGSLPTAADVQTGPMEDGGSLTVKETLRGQPVQSISTLKAENSTDWNNNQETSGSNHLHGVTVVNTRPTRLVMEPCSSGHEVTAKETPASRPPNLNYCWFYFSEHNACMRPVCWFLHLPRDGDEKFCIDTVRKFCYSGKHNLIVRAVEVFMGYYSRCSPSVSFSQETVNSLLSSLLNMGLLREFKLVIDLLLTHKKMPPPEIVLAVFKLVRERGLISAVSELIVLTSKIVEAGCVFSVDQCEVMQNHLQMMQVPRQHMDVFLAVKCRALATNPHTSELSDLAQAVVSVEILKHQEDWAGLALVFCSVCVGSYSPSELMRFCCCVTMALLKESKLSLPYEMFAHSVCQKESDEKIKTILGRIGVSLIFRYHRTREWSKGVKLVSVMFGLDIEFLTLKGLMGNEHKVSRCQLVTMATEFFLHSGSIEGALKILRADSWFVSSSVWPCEQADIESRKRVMTLLSGKTSHRDAFEILTNLPGLRQPIPGVLVKEYTDMFRAHMRLCVMKQTFPVAADLLEFMLMQGMEPETQQLQILIHKLGKQNNWSRARALFKRARAAGFYSAVVCEPNGLFLPCSLSEIEMTLAFEMFITFTNTSLQTPNGPSQPLLITLRRLGEVEEVTESVYLAAGCRLLSAALIPNPKLSIRYTAVNHSQEQLFQLDRGSAHKWFLQNERWAQEVWVS